MSTEEGLIDDDGALQKRYRGRRNESADTLLPGFTSSLLKDVRNKSLGGQIVTMMQATAYFDQVVRRIAGILLVGPALDVSYQAILPTATGLSALQIPIR